MSSGTRRVGRGAVLGLAAVGLLTAACGGGGSAGNSASSSTTSSTRVSSTTAGPSPVTPTTAGPGTVTTTTKATTATTSASPGGATSTSTTVAPTTVRIDSSQNGRTVALHVGDTVQISLTGCGGCGYSWRMTGQPSPVVFSYEGEQSSTPSTTSTSAGQPPITGQPVTWTWTFKAVSAHTTGFIAQYYPPGQGARSTQTFAVQLRVTA